MPRSPSRRSRETSSLNNDDYKDTKTMDCDGSEDTKAVEISDSDSNDREEGHRNYRWTMNGMAALSLYIAKTRQRRANFTGKEVQLELQAHMYEAVSDVIAHSLTDQDKIDPPP